jgi:rare lipoprotein A (peptidoglycan hydrolase)
MSIRVFSNAGELRPSRSRWWLAGGCISYCQGLLLVAASCLTVVGSWSLGSAAAEAKTPGRSYCFNGVCHRVKTLAETRREVGKARIVVASHYDSCHRDRYNPCGLTSSGERYDPSRPNNAASPNYPNGTLLLVWNPRTKKSVVVRINNAGPYWGNRRLDLSRAAAQRLGFRGVAKLHVKVLKAPTAAQARYKRNRRYQPAPGYIGQFASIGSASANARRQFAGLLGGGRDQGDAASRATSSAAVTSKRRSADRTRVSSGRGAGSKEVVVQSKPGQKGRTGSQWFRESVADYKAKRGAKSIRETKRKTRGASDPS